MAASEWLFDATAYVKIIIKLQVTKTNEKKMYTAANGFCTLFKYKLLFAG